MPEHEILYQNALCRANAADIFQLAIEWFSIMLHVQVAVHVWKLNLTIINKMYSVIVKNSHSSFKFNFKFSY